MKSFLIFRNGLALCLINVLYALIFFGLVILTEMPRKFDSEDFQKSILGVAFLFIAYLLLNLISYALSGLFSFVTKSKKIKHSFLFANAFLCLVIFIYLISTNNGVAPFYVLFLLGLSPLGSAAVNVQTIRILSKK